MTRPADLRRLGWLLGRYLAPHWRAVGLLLLASYLAMGLAGLLPVLMAPILDLALGAPAGSPVAGGGVTLGDLTLRNLGAAVLHGLGVQAVSDRFQAIVVLAGLYVAAGVLKGWADFGNYLLALWIRIRAGAAMQMDLFQHLLGLSMGFFTKQRAGELVSRLDADTRGATSGLETIVGTFLTAPVLLGFYGYLLVRTSPKLVVAALGAGALHYGITRAVRGPIRRLATDQFSVFADLAARFQEALTSIRVVKSFGAEAFERAGAARILADVVRLNVKFGVYKHVEEPARSVVNYVVEASFLVLAAYELLAGRMAVPTFFLFLYVGRALMAQRGLLGSAYTQLQSALAASTRVSELFAQRPAVEDGPESISAFRDRIRLRDVSFHYGGEPVLERVSFEVLKGEVVALVGPSGVGKSTLADLILRLYDPVAGAITIDGRDLRSLRQAAYRRLFGVVSQEALLFNASIRDNIAYGREGLSEADIVRAATIANAHEFVTEFPEGYETVVGDRGIRLSGGQRQRIAIARAIVARPALLVLDEATSSLDSESERLVQEAIDRVIEGTTSIVIAHRLSTVLHADKIIVLGKGGIEAIGRHGELLDSNETYARLYRLQFTERETAARP
ncbi:MAG: ABC transporter ATP-binding protein [Candidatus Rokubacteria bacterium]|nr:ABC transporter ATP-binding protein [Candidatus Rokubacteria bacterium]